MSAVREAERNASGQGRFAPLIATLFEMRIGAQARTSVYFAVVLTTIASLILTLPTARYYRSEDYWFDNFDIEVSTVFDADALDRLSDVAKPGSLVAFTEFAPATVEHDGRSVGPTTVSLTSTPDRIGQAWYPDSTTVAATSIEGPWIDLSAKLARELGVGPGDTVTIPLVLGPYHVKVRRVLAVSRMTIPYAAVGPLTDEATELLGYVPDPTVAVLRTNLPAEAVGALVGDPEAVSARSRTEVLDQVLAGGITAMPVVLTLAILGLGALIGLSLREGVALVRSSAAQLATLIGLGVTRRRLTSAVVVFETPGVLVAAATAYWATTAGVYRYLLAPAFVPEFAPQLGVALGAGAAAYLAGWAAVTWRKTAPTFLLRAMTEGAHL